MFVIGHVDHSNFNYTMTDFQFKYEHVTGNQKRMKENIIVINFHGII